MQNLSGEITNVRECSGTEILLDEDAAFESVASASNLAEVNSKVQDLIDKISLIQLNENEYF
jgi:hypothetical protein